MIADKDDVRRVNEIVEFSDKAVLQVDRRVIAATGAAHALGIGLLDEGS